MFYSIVEIIKSRQLFPVLHGRMRITAARFFLIMKIIRTQAKFKREGKGREQKRKEKERNRKRKRTFVRFEVLT